MSTRRRNGGQVGEDSREPSQAILLSAAAFP